MHRLDSPVDLLIFVLYFIYLFVFCSLPSIFVSISILLIIFVIIFFLPHTHTSPFLPSVVRCCLPKECEAGEMGVCGVVRIFWRKGMKDGARRWPLPHGRRDPPAAVLLAGLSCSLGSLVAPTPHPSFPISASSLSLSGTARAYQSGSPRLQPGRSS